MSPVTSGLSLRSGLVRRTIVMFMYVYSKRVCVKTEKLTLRLEEELIERAKRAATERGTSVSKMVAGFFESIEDPRANEPDSESGEITRRLRGSIRREDGRGPADEEDYRRYLERKHGP